MDEKTGGSNLQKAHSRLLWQHAHAMRQTIKYNCKPNFGRHTSCAAAYRREEGGRNNPKAHAAVVAVEAKDVKIGVIVEHV